MEVLCGFITWITVLNAWIPMVVDCLTGGERERGHGQKLYLNSYGKY